MFTGAGVSAAAGTSEHGRHAATTSHMTSSHSASPDMPDVNNALTYMQVDFGGSGIPAPCDAGVNYDWNALDPVKSAVNNCEYPVLLQWPDSNPPAFCIDPHSSRSNIGSTYWYPSVVTITTDAGGEC